MKICVLGASSRELRQEYYDAAFELGAEMARRGHELVFGGGTSGLCLGAAARGMSSVGGRGHYRRRPTLRRARHPLRGLSRR